MSQNNKGPVVAVLFCKKVDRRGELGLECRVLELGCARLEVGCVRVRMR